MNRCLKSIDLGSPYAQDEAVGLESVKFLPDLLPIEKIRQTIAALKEELSHT
jgi:hypothetical protein